MEVGSPMLVLPSLCLLGLPCLCLLHLLEMEAMTLPTQTAPLRDGNTRPMRPRRSSHFSRCKAELETERSLSESWASVPRSVHRLQKLPFQVVASWGGSHPKSSDDEMFANRPDLFNWREVWGVRRPPFKERDILVSKPSSRRCRCVTSGSILLEDRTLTALCHELDDPIACQQFNVVLGIHPARTLEQSCFSVPNYSCPHHDGPRELVLLQIHMVPPFRPPHYRTIRGRCEPGLIGE